MHTTTIIFSVIVLFFVWQGYKKGFIGSITRIVSWVIAYPTAFYFTKPVAAIISQHTSLEGLIVYFIAGGSVFITVSFIVAQLLYYLSYLIPETTITDNLSKATGAVVGLFMGGFIGLLAAYAITLAPQKNIAVRKPSIIEKNAKQLTSAIVSTGVNITIKDPTVTKLTKALIEDPKATVEHIKQLSNNDDIKEILANPDIQASLTSNNTQALLANNDFKRFVQNEHIQAILPISDKNSSEEIIAKTMSKAWQRANAIKDDPRVLEIINDPDFQQKMNSTNKMAMMTDPRVKALADIIFDEEESNLQKQASINASVDVEENTTDINTTEVSTTEVSTTEVSTTEKSSWTEPTIYKWKDEQGVTHFSDAPAK
jgi:uncharacterized membrane protein required for colicin V production